eukprot:530619-Hanusia_phi.AAC.1
MPSSMKCEGVHEFRTADPWQDLPSRVPPHVSYQLQLAFPKSHGTNNQWERFLRPTLGIPAVPHRSRCHVLPRQDRCLAAMGLSQIGRWALVQNSTGLVYEKRLYI